MRVWFLLFFCLLFAFSSSAQNYVKHSLALGAGNIYALKGRGDMTHVAYTYTFHKRLAMGGTYYGGSVSARNTDYLSTQGGGIQLYAHALNHNKYQLSLGGGAIISKTKSQKTYFAPDGSYAISKHTGNEPLLYTVLTCQGSVYLTSNFGIGASFSKLIIDKDLGGTYGVAVVGMCRF